MPRAAKAKEPPFLSNYPLTVSDHIEVTLFRWVSRGPPGYTGDETTMRRPSIHLMVKSHNDLFCYLTPQAFVLLAGDLDTSGRSVELN